MTVSPDAGTCCPSCLSAQPFPGLPSWQVSTRELRRKDDEMRNIRVHALLHVGAIIAVDIFFHFFYILTLPSDLKFVNRLSDWSLGEWPCLDTFTPVLSFKAVVSDSDLSDSDPCPSPLRGFGNAYVGQVCVTFSLLLLLPIDNAQSWGQAALESRWCWPDILTGSQCKLFSSGFKRLSTKPFRLPLSGLEGSSAPPKNQPRAVARGTSGISDAFTGGHPLWVFVSH